MRVCSIDVARGEPPPLSLLGCGVAGVVGAIGLVALYRALADSRMGMAAPISGVLTAAVPVVVGALVQGLSRRLTLAGFALAFVAVWLVSRTDEGRVEMRELGLPVAAGLGFGIFIVLIGRASGEAVFRPLVTARVASLSVLTLVSVAARRPVWPAGPHLPLVVLAGLLDAAGNVFVVLAAHAGRLDVAGVLASLFPASMVLLAFLILKERITEWHFAGLSAALSAIVLITLS